jgi:drug/metabolite transporter (DMT)-like permease
MPLMTLLLAAAIGYERVTFYKAAGVILSIVGVGFAMGDKALQTNGPVHGWTGELAVLASAFSGALCSVLYRPYLRKYPTLPVSTFAMFASVLFLALLAAGEGFFEQPLQFSSGGWLAVAFIGINSGIGYFLWLWALNHTSATNVTVFLALSPVTATALGAGWLNEPVSATFVTGLVCVAAGLWLAHRKKTAGR